MSPTIKEKLVRPLKKVIFIEKYTKIKSDCFRNLRSRQKQYLSKNIIGTTIIKLKTNVWDTAFESRYSQSFKLTSFLEKYFRKKFAKCQKRETAKSKTWKKKSKYAEGIKEKKSKRSGSYFQQTKFFYKIVFL